MTRKGPLTLGALSLNSLAACLTALLGVSYTSAHPAAPTNAIPVTNCADSGAGSLRDAVQSSINGDTIDLTQLTCGRITLTSGRLDTLNNLLLQGPGSSLLTIDGNNSDRIINQNGAGAQLGIYGLTLTRGYASSFPGGCVYSAGPLLLNDAVITGCRVFGLAGISTYEGGGVYVKGTLSLISSHIDDNEVYSSLGSAAGGGAMVTGNLIMVGSTISRNTAESVGSNGAIFSGGADVGGSLYMEYSTIADNTASGLLPNESSGGGVSCTGAVVIHDSTISGNTAGSGAGLIVEGHNAMTSSLIANSTISGNISQGIGGAYFRTTVTIANSTIAFNSESYPRGAGLRIAYGLADIESSIVANNGGDTTQYNIGLGLYADVSGGNNIIGPSGSTTLPPDTIQSDPRLLPLANNGGTTLTHALRPDSPAINAGNNRQPLSSDQRGPGFPRVIGPAADIGAVEFDSDTIFADGFD